MDPNAGKRTLVNKLSREELQAKLDAESFHRTTVSFYKYVIIENPQALRDELFAQWSEWDCLGRIYVSREGINAQMNVPQHIGMPLMPLYTAWNISMMYPLNWP